MKIKGVYNYQLIDGQLCPLFLSVLNDNNLPLLLRLHYNKRYRFRRGTGERKKPSKAYRRRESHGMIIEWIRRASENTAFSISKPLTAEWEAANDRRYPAFRRFGLLLGPCNASFSPMVSYRSLLIHQDDQVTDGDGREHNLRADIRESELWRDASGY